MTWEELFPKGRESVSVYQLAEDENTIRRTGTINKNNPMVVEIRTPRAEYGSVVILRDVPGKSLLEGLESKGWRIDV